MHRLITAWIATDIGSLRPRNEDRCCVGPWFANGRDGSWVVALTDDHWLAAVADGMGGHQAGELASETVIAELRFRADRLDSDSAVNAVLEQVNQKVFEAMFTPRGGAGMGSTIVGIVFRKGEGLFFNLGDSRAYVCRRNELFQVSVDHTLDRGLSNGTRSHRLTQSLGGTTQRTPINPHVRSVRLDERDIVLLCSDGLTDMLGNDEILDVLSHNYTDHPARALVAAALQAGGRDNVTAIVIGTSPESWETS